MKLTEREMTRLGAHWLKFSGISESGGGIVTLERRFKPINGA
jgi:hypothetical protein